MIEIKSVHKIFNPGKANQVNPVNGVSLQVIDGEFLVIVGANGSGKTTLLDMVAGSVLPNSGKVHIDDHDVTKLPDYQRSKWIARVFQNPMSGTASDLSILDNFRLAARRTKAKGLPIGINDAVILIIVLVYPEYGLETILTIDHYYISFLNNHRNEGGG